MCLKADGEGEQAKLGIICSDSQSKWDLISESKMHIATKLTCNGSSVCLDIGSDGSTIVTSLCKCLGKDKTCDPATQWFKMVNSTRSVVNKNMLCRGSPEEGTRAEQ